MVKKVEIYFRDLTPEAQNRLLKEFGTTAEEENWDVFPISEIERELEDAGAISAIHRQKGFKTGTVR